MEIINVGHTNYLVKVASTWVQASRSLSKSSLELLTNTWNLSFRIKVAQNKTITDINFLKKQFMGPMLIFQ
jgi:hypothetical protein